MPATQSTALIRTILVRIGGSHLKCVITEGIIGYSPSKRHEDKNSDPKKYRQKYPSNGCRQRDREF
jgi:hypothetical protein